MNKCQVNTHDFCCIHGDTQFSKEFIIDEATDEWDLALNIYSVFGVLMNRVDLRRVNTTTWQWEQHSVKLPVGNYKYTLCYHFREIERMILKGNIIVNNHL